MLDHPEPTSSPAQTPLEADAYQGLFSRPLPAPLAGDARTKARTWLDAMLFDWQTPDRTEVGIKRGQVASIVDLVAQDPTLLVDDAGGGSLAFLAVARNATPVLEVLIDKGFDIDAQLPTGQGQTESLLRHAIDFRDSSLSARWLVERGARLDVAEEGRDEIVDDFDLPLDRALWHWLGVNWAWSAELLRERDPVVQAMLDRNAPSRTGVVLLGVHEAKHSRTLDEWAGMVDTLLARRVPAVAWEEVNETFFEIALRASPVFVLKVLDAYGLDDPALYGGVDPRSQLDEALERGGGKPESMAAARAWLARAAFTKGTSEVPDTQKPGQQASRRPAGRGNVM